MSNLTWYHCADCGAWATETDLAAEAEYYRADDYACIGCHSREVWEADRCACIALTGEQCCAEAESGYSHCAAHMEHDDDVDDWLARQGDAA